ncbi:MAG: uracil-DNA glycosylase [Candidatus Zambryskibacteria bacterium CG_4_9_14_3_um_filter_40_16]|uniref:Type-4 uracil-DNA glycosylase n=2 Tax=Candidatus Zambryskiibacteriota TaxID=1817925 RepID=A0A2H0K8E5_9BACT|nr:MAG: uracil-DNA glycosylase [Candidatus Zambryskibacteria bacterium CG11_big_fil_rev_8_21_14_0_20_40_24]PJA33519.1 MAG: uracil-DNA glycosylase [Candidatus Zambryskibacteria bacterium CG_4_9_14_3_um_filter_40_16]
MANDKKERMKKIRDEILSFSLSSLYNDRVQNKMFPVIGEGNHNANILFIGEAPGKNEAMTGKPFCGRSGKVLDDLLEYIGIQRSDVYITNIVKDRPPENRDPTPEEIELYAPFLDRQIDIIQPKIIATLGRFSMVYIMKKFGLERELLPISAIHGRVFETSASFGKLKIIPLYHPAVAVYDSNKLNDLKKDFDILKQSI